MPLIDIVVDQAYILQGIQVHVINPGIDNWKEFCTSRIYQHSDPIVQSMSSDRFVAGYVSFGTYDDQHFLDPQLEPPQYVNWEFSQFRVPQRQFPPNMIRLWMRKGVHGFFTVVKSIVEQSAGGMLVLPH